MPYDPRLADQLRLLLQGTTDITEKKMFGGIAFLYKGKMIVGVMANQLIVRVPASRYTDVLEQADVQPMAFGGRKPMKEFVSLNGEDLSDPEDLLPWIELGIAHAKGILGEG